MKPQQMTPVAIDPAMMWTLNTNKRSVRLTLPPLSRAGQAKPLFVVLDFGATTVDEIIDRLLSLRGQMQPKRAAETEIRAANRARSHR
jgi:hypothetical protein